MMAEIAPAPLGRLLRMSEVVAETGVHRATVYRWINEGSFPQPLRIGRKCSRWPQRLVEEWKHANLPPSMPV